ncbi:peptidase U32 family protein [Peredibacter sp. HCB2-198]|uniref:peptidase U32 family protein n=1 Tax=Peredibacter sp. HCB2-198 TaxID=3383025 RepID=UPI0038B53DA5
MTKHQLPEVLAPAGSLDKLKIAVLYGANAIYVGGQKFGLRTAADNFTLDELREGMTFAHERGAQVYVVLNSFLHDKDLEEVPEFVKFLEEIGTDAVIVSDLGVVKTVRAHSKIPVHISTQASTLNSESARIWKEAGATRIVLGREVSVKEAGKIKREVDIEIEMFIHGSMCMAYSGHCVISNFTQGRDSNRGGCAHSCRFEYSLEGLDTPEKKKAYFMSSKDLEGLRVLPAFIEEKIDSLKIEGRMKSHLYAGTMSKVYSEALQYYAEHGDFLSDDLLNWEAELSKVSHRSYTEASLVEKAGADSIFNERENASDGEWQMVGSVIDATPSAGIVIEVRNAFNQGDELEIIPFKGPAIKVVANEIMDLAMKPVTRTRPTTLVRLPFVEGVSAMHLVRQRGKA